MADSMPICNVLGEAIEYLSKLGTNIRIRSENLREKRIKKEKLRNTHAIHKAVDKVLLICELSKKSIENVETGVKNLLLQMEKAGTTYGSSSNIRATSDTDVQYEYFKYESHTLKIRNKISVNHYTSVKVMTTSMSLSTLEKYPVYHDCKLYRMRKKKKKRELATSIRDSIEIADIGFQYEDNKFSYSESVIDTDSLEKIKRTLGSDAQEKTINEEASNVECPNKSKSEERDNPLNVDMKKNDEVVTQISSGETVETIFDKDLEESARKRIKKSKTERKRFKHIRVIDDSSNSERENDDKVVMNSESVLKNDVESEVADNSRLASIESNSSNKDLEVTSLGCNEKQENDEDTNEVEKKKPMIKCVSLSKLLKPEITLNTQSEPRDCKQTDKDRRKIRLSKSERRHSKSERRQPIELKRISRSVSSDDDDHDDVDAEEIAYWARKRKEVKNFKPKECTVNVTRLSKITILQRCQLKCDTDKVVSCNETTEPESKKYKIGDRIQVGSPERNVDIDKVKSALLNDSDSDISIKNDQSNSESLVKTKHSCQTISSDVETEDSKNLLEKKATERTSSLSILKHKNENLNKEIQKSDNAKTSLLSDSDNEQVKVPSETERVEWCEEINKSNCEPKDKDEQVIPKQRYVMLDESESGSENSLNKKHTTENLLDKSHCETLNTSVHDETNCKQQNTYLMPALEQVEKNKDNTDKDNHNTKNKGNAELESLFQGNKQHGITQDAQDESVDDSKNDSTKFESDNMETNLLSKCYDGHPNRNVENTKSIQESQNGSQKDNQDIEKGTNSILDESRNNTEMHGANKNDVEDNSMPEEESNGRVQKEAESIKKSLICDSDAECDNIVMSVSNNVTEAQKKTEDLKNDFLNDSSCQTQNPDRDKELMDEESNSVLSKNGDKETQEEEHDKSTHECTEGSIYKSTNNKELNNEIEDQGALNVLQEKCQTQEQKSEDIEIVKSTLLKDSSDDHSKTPKKRKNHSEYSPPHSKRKHIMESMYAKKMLLTYSSSSDTEDELLRNTLREIKNDLLKGISSDEDLEKDDNKIDNAQLKVKNERKIMGKCEEISEESNSKIKTKGSSSADSDKDTQKDNPESAIGSNSDNSSVSKISRSRDTPDGSGSQNSDIPDAHDKEIDGLTNLSTLKKTYRRRDSTSSQNTQSTKFSKKRKMAKAGGLISNEGFLQAESSSDAASSSGSDHGDNVDNVEDLPEVKMADLNGDGIGHLAKDDLLEESDTSMSHDEKKDFKKEDDSEDDDNVKSKRRKAHAISSDSEVGSSRRKSHLRVSDFEDSEDESSEPAKSKRKQKANDSDASVTSVDSSKKKRRRIRNPDDSDVSGSDTENEGRNKHGRKNIRKVMGKNQLEEATKRAAREEKERIARIAERQKLYNNLEFDESGKPDEVLLEKVVLDFDPETKEPLIQVDRGLVKKLKPHQANGIKFMWDACFESVKRIKKDKGSGCILAHCMGLGKTLQVVSLTHTLLTHSTLTGVSRVLVVCPLSTVLNWVNEFRMWLKHADSDYEVDVYELSKFKQNSERAFQLSQWFEYGGVCVLGYEMFRNLSAENAKKFKKKMLKNLQESLVDPGPDLVVCDEGHLLKNEKTSLSQSMNRVKTLRRIVLTGTPLQNNLKEYYCMVQFVKPNLLGKYNEYLNRFVNPITNGQYTDSTEHDIRVMKRRSHVLHKMLDGAVQRRDYGVLAPFLPPKHEYVLFITLTEVQIKLYQNYLDNYSRRPLPGKSSGFLFPDFQSLQRIWTHPLVLQYNSVRYERMQKKKREKEEEEDSLEDFIDDDSTPDESSTDESSDSLSDISDDSRKKSKKNKSAKDSKAKESKVTTRRGTRANPVEVDEEEVFPEALEAKDENPTEWWKQLVAEEELEDMRNSHKLVLLFEILRQCEAIGDKLLVFSQSLYSLDLIEDFLHKVDDATQDGRVEEKLGGHVGSWSQGVDYFRLDGSTSCENRSIWCKNFNREDNPRARLFLISTRAGGLGINLVAANRVVIFDVSWNPSHDVQSIFRVYRFGQKKPCYIYRFLAMGTMEEKIYERQVTKQAISKRVIDEQQIDRHYAENDLAELYKFEPQPPVPRPLPPLPKDRLFAEMLKEHEAQIYKYHEHDSLLENKEEETLSEEERRAAWEDFENEKARPPPQPFVSPYAMVPGLLAQQQHPLASRYAAFMAMLQKEMPNNSDQQNRDMLSLMHNANPAMYGGYDYGLMQKMGDMFKYLQSGMMNPAMMNPVMNAGSGGSIGGMGGTSGLQYEPPWQRQQQQQQQMRLQQLLQQQQQNQMGAKYYAGGLGSRDPHAMALQHQRARELMLGPRPRGRPPLAHSASRAAHPAHPHQPHPAHPAHPAPASPTPADVVNLDSD